MPEVKAKGSMMITNREIAAFLQFEKTATNDWISPLGENIYLVLDFKNDARIQLEALRILGEKTILRGFLTISIHPDRVEIAQGHYFAKKPTFEEAVWSFLTWVTHHEYRKG